MASAKRDDNASPTLTGVSSADGTTVTRALADPTTGYILMAIKPIANFSTTNPNIRIDDNSIPVLRGVTNNASQTVKPLLCDPNNAGYILSDVLIL